MRRPHHLLQSPQPATTQPAAREVAHLFDKLGPEEIAQIHRLRAHDSSQDFFWIDVDLKGGSQPSERPTYSIDEVAEALGIPERVPDRALAALGDFEEGHSLASKFHADDLHVVFPFFYVPKLESLAGEAAAAAPPIEVHVLVHGQYLLTVSKEPLDLQARTGEISSRHRSEEYVVYAALEAMAVTAFEALADVEDGIEELEEELLRSRRANRRQRSEIVRGMRARLTSLRRRIGAERAIFERVGEEIDSVAGLQHDKMHDLFDRVGGQLDRVVDGIDAASQALSSLIDLGINETTYRLTVVATIFLPLSFVTGFFGMNFDWLVTRIDTGVAFFVIGLGSLAISWLAAAWLIAREETLPTSSADN
jgi:magnesium transporter